ncbi:taurine catabolism dioxygenase [Atractiella rhizophila]|nr:taurine catabolism dioxygenase [Atractiella rhizophila]
MSTTTTTTVTEAVQSLSLSGEAAPHGGNTLQAPLKYGGSLDKFTKFDSTPIIGTEFVDVQLSDLLKAENADELIRDLAILVSQRGVVFFRAQDLDIEAQKELGRKLGSLTGKPKESTLHIHPVIEETSELGDEVSIITSERRPEYSRNVDDRPTLSSNGWHADITFEPVPSDYAILKIHTLPETGGDTLWASGYDAYDRLSPNFAKFLEGLEARHEAHFFRVIAERLGFRLRNEVRGNPANHGDQLEAVHPVIRTNPVTGWKSIFVNKNFTKRLIGVTRDESDTLLPYINRHVIENHSSQVRFKWQKNSIAIWDNRSTYHTATFDYKDKRVGDRIVSIGEKPYFDPSSISRAQALGIKYPEQGAY